MRASVTLGFMALLAACGGSGTPTVEVSPPIAEEMPLPIAEEMMPEVQPPDPVTFVFDNGDKVELTATDGSLVFDGVTYQIDVQQVIHATESSVSSIDTSTGLSLARVAGGDASSTFAVLTAILDIDTTSYIMALQGSSIAVPTLDNVPMGTARFQGEYAGFLIIPGPFNRNGGPQNDTAPGALFGDVILDVEFADYLS